MKKKSMVIVAVLVFVIFALAGTSAYLFVTGIRKVSEAMSNDIMSISQDFLPQEESEVLGDVGQGTLVADIINYSDVDLVLLEITDGEGNTEREHFRFSLRPPVKGSHKLMIPVINRAPVNDLAVFGIDVAVAVDGKSCTLTKGDDVVSFDVESITCFKNNKPFHFLTDMPFYNNGALYIPLETILDAFEIPYLYEENKLVVKLGG